MIRFCSLSSRQEPPEVRGSRLLDSLRLETDARSPAAAIARKSSAGTGTQQMLAIPKLCSKI